jgi:thioredoxin-dependent peroxiredoxin
MLNLSRSIFVAGLVVLASPCWLAADYVDPDRPPYLRPGDRAPVFTCLDDQGKQWRAAEHYGKKYVLVCFYLGDFFKPCTEELRILRDSRSLLTAADVEIVAISGDKAANHELFKETYRLNFALLADESGKVGRSFGVAMSGGGQQRIPHPKTKEEITLYRGATAARWSFLIGKDGRILHKDTNVNSKEQPRQILELLAKQKKTR